MLNSSQRHKTIANSYIKSTKMTKKPLKENGVEFRWSVIAATSDLWKEAASVNLYSIDYSKNYERSSKSSISKSSSSF